MKAHLVLAVVLVTASSAWADEPAGCDNFKWQVQHERAALSQPNLPKLAAGGDLAGPLPLAVTLALQPAGEAKLPSPPERAPKPDTYSGFGTVTNLPANGIYSVSLSAAGWVDVLQNGVFLKPKAFSGVTGCTGIRKTMKFELTTGTAIIQISGVSAPEINLAIMPVTE